MMRKWIFKNRGLLLLPCAFMFLILGKPTVMSFLYGSLFLFAGEAVRIWGVGYAGLTTRSGNVEAPYLVTAGPYSYIRNPLYFGNFFIGLGFCIMACGGIIYPVKLFLLLFFFLSYILVYASIIPLEEAFLKEEFGEDYISYAKKVPRIIPFKKPYLYKKGTFSWAPVKRGEVHTLIYLSLAFMYFFTRAFNIWIPG